MSGHKLISVTSKWPHQDTIKVEWNLGKRCNLDCAYCPAEIHDNHSPHTNINILMDTVDALAEIGKPIRLSLTGGEPCAHPDIEDLIKYAKLKLDWLNISTNATRQPGWYANQNVDHYMFSLHFEKDWRRLLKNIQAFKYFNDEQWNVPFMVNIMAHHKYMKEVREAKEELDKDYIKNTVRRIRWTEGDHDIFDDMRYDGNDLEWLMNQKATVLPNCVIDYENAPEVLKHANDIIKEHENQFKGWKCSAGIESLMINWDGEVHRATCRVGGSLGNIYDGSFEPPEEWVTCTRDWCTCAADIPLSKTRS
jgi:MoaA/NifB/PqqE/SkfB family radical SAM enzyme